MTTISIECPVIDEFEKACARGHGLYEGITLMAEAGKLGLLAEDFARLAEQVSKSGYVPPARRAEYERHMKLAKDVRDREVAAWHRDKAREIRSQASGTCVFCSEPVSRDEYKASHFGGKCVGGAGQLREREGK